MSDSQSLNCELGSLAITVNAKFSGNIGKVVRIIDSYGLIPWPELVGKVHVWQVELATKDSFLHYYYPSKHKLDTTCAGPIPDCYLRRLVPMCGQLRLAFDEVYRPNNEEMAL